MPYSFGQRITARVVEAAGKIFFGLSTRHVRHACRWHLRGPLDDVLRSDEPLILAIWHQDTLPLFHYLVTFSAFLRKRRFAMLASRSFDGELTERILRPWRFRFVRGSHGKTGGQAALRGLLRALEQGDSVVVVADGPRPPPYRMRPGPAFLARASGAPLYVARAWARPQLLLPRTWFRMAIPLPSSHLALFSEGPIDARGDVEAIRVRAETALNRMCEEADAHLYLRRRVAGGTRLCGRPWRAPV